MEMAAQDHSGEYVGSTFDIKWLMHMSKHLPLVFSPIPVPSVLLLTGLTPSLSRVWFYTFLWPFYLVVYVEEGFVCHSSL